MSQEAGYSSLVRQLFREPAHAGTLPPGEGQVVAAEAAALDRGAWVQLAARVRGGRVVEARFLAWGCPHFVAACELATARLEGTRPGTAVAQRVALDLAGELAAPPDRLGRLLVLEDALRDLAAAAAESQ